MFDSVMKTTLAHKQIIVTAAAFAIVIGSFAFQNAAAQTVIVGNGQAIVNANDGRYAFAGDGTAFGFNNGRFAFAGGGLSGFGNGFMP